MAERRDRAPACTGERHHDTAIAAVHRVQHQDGHSPGVRIERGKPTGLRGSMPGVRARPYVFPQ